MKQTRYSESELSGQAEVQAEIRAARVNQFKINVDSAVIYRLPFAMVNAECLQWFKRRPNLTRAEIEGARQLEIAGKWYMGIRCETVARARELAKNPFGPVMCNPFAEDAR